VPLIKNLKEKKEDYLKALALRFSSQEDFKKGLEVYENFRTLKKEVDGLRAERNKKTLEFSKTKDKKIIGAVRELKVQLSRKEGELKKTEEELRNIELTLPNWVHEEVPIGKNDTKNMPVKYIWQQNNNVSPHLFCQTRSEMKPDRLLRNCTSNTKIHTC